MSGCFTLENGALVSLPFVKKKTLTGLSKTCG
jgi:hypothetical protein